MLFLFSCGISIKSVEKTFVQNKVEIHTDYESGRISQKNYLLFVVINDNDTEFYNSPITKILKIDTSKKDVLVYKSLVENYAVVKLYRKEFNSLLVHLDEYDHHGPFKDDVNAFNSSENFIFISHPDVLVFYGEMNLSEPKEEIHDLIWVGFGP